MTIRGKLYLAFIGSAISVVVVGALSIRSLSVTAGSLHQTIDITLRDAEESARAAESAVALDGEFDDFVDAIASKQAPNAAAAKNRITMDFRALTDAITALRSHADRILKTSDTPIETGIERQRLMEIDDLEADRAHFQQSWEAICRGVETGGKVDNDLLHIEDVQLRQLLSKSFDLQNKARMKISDTLIQNARSAQIQWFVVVGVGALAVALTATMAFMTARPLGRRLQDVRAKAGQLGRGDLSTRISVKGNDEISALAATFNQMAESLAASQEQLVQAAGKAHAGSAAKSTFLANMSHEIRTPMTAIMGYAERLLERKKDLGEHAEALQIIHRSGRHLLEIINDILDISKIEANKMTVEQVATDLPQVAVEVISLLRARAVAQGLLLQLTFADVIPRTIRSDPLRLKQILMNVVGNALKFTRRGEVRLHVSYEPRGESSLIVLEVTDTGIGITREQLARLFQPFTQADDSTTRRFGGTGLGLTISKRLAELLGGDLAIDSVANVGSCVRVTIDGGPLAGVEMLRGLNESVLAIPTAEPDAHERIKLSCRILLAEDGPENQKLISLHLTEAGAEVTVAKNGRVALDLVERQPFDLILMDMQMPEMDGYTAATELRNRGCQLPIIALTAHAMSDDRAKCLRAGCTAYVPKPIDRHLLLSTIAQSLQAPGSEAAADAARPASPIQKHVPAQTSPHELLRSSLAGEPQFHALIQEYTEGLPAQIDRLEAALRDNDMERLRRELHDIRGTAGGLGFRPLTELAGQLSDRAKSSPDIAYIENQVRGLIDAIQHVEGFNPHHPRPAEVADEQA